MLILFPVTWVLIIYVCFASKQCVSLNEDSGKLGGTRLAPTKVQNSTPVNSSLLRPSNDWFGKHYANDVANKLFESPDLTIEMMFSEDLSMYPQQLRQKLLKRRNRAADLKRNSTQWAGIALGLTMKIMGELIQPDQPTTVSATVAIKDLADNHLLNPLEDFVTHSFYFQIVSNIMHAKGVSFVPQGQKGSTIHDIDKLDPVMLVAYADKFQDGLDTELWNRALRRHKTINPHHETCPVWENQSSTTENEILQNAIREMVCDKTSRRLQKDMAGKFDDQIWDIDLAWFKGLPEIWMKEIQNILNQMRN